MPDEIFVTNDAVMITGVGFLDPGDVAEIKGREVWSMKRVLQFEEGRTAFREELPGERHPGALTPEQLERLTEDVWLKHNAFLDLLDPYITSAKAAAAIRRKRVDQRYSWRALARWLSYQPGFGFLVGTPVWTVQNNQLAGMAACALAAEYFNEDPRQAPWNSIPEGR